MGGGTANDERNDNSRLCILDAVLFSIAIFEDVRSPSWHPGLWSSFIFIFYDYFSLWSKRFFIFRVLSSERGFKKGRRTFGIQRGPRQSILFVSWDHCYIIQKLQKEIFELTLNFFIKIPLRAPYKAHADDDGELFIGDSAFGGEMGYSIRPVK